ncbi:peptidoglycan-recognition protein LB-like isoform X2 [Hermetia illucens]|uniref:peptidoglycan-recognition protein LB-like isoform X2 n=1 Tax=Hermetia illucens TaxID=343691 RepID=UPI0018CC31A2|nr:peptidoglycan-recognition protein LB-like isoform X2 [Hermetia illucens]
MYKTIGIIAVVCVFLPESMTIVTREEWGAKPPKTPTLFNGPSPYVIIHHSYEPGACYTAKECQEAVQSIQELHQEVRGWSDVGYTFLIGGDGNVYEGRGFNVVGAHAPGYNDKSVGICLIGDWRTELPTEKMLEATHKLIEYGISSGYIVKDYKLLGHRQVKETECPGDRLFGEIITWSHWTALPRSTLINKISPNSKL